MYPFTGSTPIDKKEFDRLRAGAQVLELDGRGEKVLLTPDKRIIKLFYPRRRFSSAHIYPYAFRFRNNARRLAGLGIATVQCQQLCYDKTNRRHIITYPLLPGTTLRDCLNASDCGGLQLKKLAGFMAGLHAKGILFRSIHLGNVLVLEDGGFGLIDIADMSIRRWSLGLLSRARNFRHLLHDKRDRDILGTYGYERFLDTYETTANITGSRSRLLRALIRRYAPVMKI